MSERTLDDLRREAAEHNMVLVSRDLGEYLTRPATRRVCPVCRGVGSIPGFWLGTLKTCTSCHGEGI